MWTVEQVKEKLPTVSVLLQGQKLTAYITGRMRRSPKLVLADRVDAPWDATWNEIVEALNGRKELVLE